MLVGGQEGVVGGASFEANGNIGLDFPGGKLGPPATDFLLTGKSGNEIDCKALAVQGLKYIDDGGATQSAIESFSE